jgi:tetratricopeptide (TPR) repeat protein
MLINQKVSICLNMIVKNESAIIRRLIDSVLPIIDSYCICDTGSTDKTPEIIESYFASYGIPGKVVHEPFQDFGYNRSNALKYCIGMDKADYLLLIDADMVLKIPKTFDINLFKQYVASADAHYMLQGTDTFFYKNIRLVKNKPGISYWGVTHEYMNLPAGTKYGFFNKCDIFIWDIGDGGAKTDKFERDIRLLKQGLKDIPNNDRYTFYLANSLRDAGKTNEAIEMYKKRISLGGWIEEPWYSHYSLGKIYKHRNEMDKAVFHWLEAYSCNPTRIENLYEIVNYYRNNGKNDLAYIFYKIAREKRDEIKNWDFLFLEKDVYDFKLDYEFSIFGYYVNKDKYDLVRCSMDLLNYHTVEPKIYKNILSNYKFYVPQIEGMHEKRYKVLSSVGDEVMKQDEFIGSTPTICFHNGELIVNRRFVNYRIDEKGNYINREKIITKNVLAYFNENNKKEEAVLLKYNTEYDGHYEGLEDVRLISHKGKLLYNANRGVDNKMFIEHGEIELYETKDEGLLKKENQNQIEKNWVLFCDASDNLKCVYKWHPLTIGSIEYGQLTDIQKINTPLSFKDIRGSSNGVIIGGELWFLTHLVSHEDRRHYYHMMVVLDPVTYGIKRYTPLFTFTGKKVEYSLGFVEIDEDILIGYSVMDKETNFISVKKKWFNDMFSRNHR